MNALTSITSGSLQISFPRLSQDFRQRVEDHLRERTESDRDKFWRDDQPFKTRSECEAASKRIACDLTEHLGNGVSVNFQRTLRIPDDGKIYPLPPGLGSFPLCHVDDFAGNVPSSWRDRGGVMLPLHQSEALWLKFSSSYPAALKVGAGKICAVSGEPWEEGLAADPQTYCALPNQVWLDGYAVETGVVRQFVAQPLGSGFTVEEQLTGKSEWGGIQLQALPYDPDLYWRYTLLPRVEAAWQGVVDPSPRGLSAFDRFWSSAPSSKKHRGCGSGMGLAAGGRMKQPVYQDRHRPWDYLACSGNRCFVHLCNSAQWELITGQAPPHQPPTAQEYSRRGFPWFDYYDEKQTALPGGERLKEIKSITQLESETGQQVLPENEEAKPKVIVKYVKE